MNQEIVPNRRYSNYFDSSVFALIVRPTRLQHAIAITYIM